MPSYLKIGIKYPLNFELNFNDQIQSGSNFAFVIISLGFKMTK